VCVCGVKMTLLVPGALASLRCQHYFVNEVDDGSRRLFGIQLCEEMADVLHRTAGLLGDKTKNSERRKSDMQMSDCGSNIRQFCNPNME